MSQSRASPELGGRQGGGGSPHVQADQQGPGAERTEHGGRQVVRTVKVDRLMTGTDRAG